MTGIIEMSIESKEKRIAELEQIISTSGEFLNGYSAETRQILESLKKELLELEDHITSKKCHDMTKSELACFLREADSDTFLIPVFMALFGAKYKPTLIDLIVAEHRHDIESSIYAGTGSGMVIRD